MSVRSDAAARRRCGLVGVGALALSNDADRTRRRRVRVQLVSRMVRIEGGEYAYSCQGCAVMAGPRR